MERRRSFAHVGLLPLCCVVAVELAREILEPCQLSKESQPDRAHASVAMFGQIEFGDSVELGLPRLALVVRVNGDLVFLRYFFLLLVGFRVIMPLFFSSSNIAKRASDASFDN